MTTTDRGLVPAGMPSPHRGAGQERDERRPVIAAFVAALVACIPTAVGASMVAGTAGLTGALVGTALVLVLFGAGAAAMMWAGRRGPGAITAVGAGGFGARLVFYAAVLMALDGTQAVHRPSLAVATGVTLVLTLGAELVVLARTPSLFALRVGDGPSARPRQSSAGGHPDPRSTDPRSTVPTVPTPGATSSHRSDRSATQ